VETCETLRQRLTIPEVQLTETIFHRYYLHVINETCATIFISKLGQRLMTVHLAQALEKYFKMSSMSDQFDKILVSSVDVLDELLRDVYKVKELPPSWMERLQESNTVANRVVNVSLLSLNRV